MVDNMTREQRSRTMSRIRSKDTQAELALRRILFSYGLRFRVHVSTLPGKPDIVFPASKVIVFVDGDFWHGWRFEAWAHKLAGAWRAKIERNRSRDVLRGTQLNALGWKVIRIWEHEVETDVNACADRVIRAISGRSAMRSTHNPNARVRKQMRSARPARLTRRNAQSGSPKTLRDANTQLRRR